MQPNLLIPYAQPPVGPLRFAALKKYNGTTTVKASRFSPDCSANVQSPSGSKITYETVAGTMSGNGIVLLRCTESRKAAVLQNPGILGQAKDLFDEDCLTVNVCRYMYKIWSALQNLDIYEHIIIIIPIWYT